jgi:hypothetical protein
VHLHGGSFDPFAYVMPALSSDGVHAAWYSDTYRPAADGRRAGAHPARSTRRGRAGTARRRARRTSRSYVMPALSSDGVHAAWYSDTYRPAGETRLEAATATGIT